MRADRSARFSAGLSVLLALFCLRVIGQVFVAFLHVSWLPPMEQWHSGLMAYPLLLPAQIAVIILFSKIIFDISHRSGWFAQPRPALGLYGTWFGYGYLGTMVARYPIRMYLHPEARWFGQTIPIVFHWVLASFVILVARSHRTAAARAAVVVLPLTLLSGCTAIVGRAILPRDARPETHAVHIERRATVPAHRR